MPTSDPSLPLSTTGLEILKLLTINEPNLLVLRWWDVRNMCKENCIDFRSTLSCHRNEKMEPFLDALESRHVDLVKLTWLAFGRSWCYVSPDKEAI